MKNQYKDIFFNDIEDYSRPDTFQNEYEESITIMLLKEYPNLSRQQVKPYVDMYMQKHYNPIDVKVFIKDEKTEDRIPTDMGIDTYLEIANSTDTTIAPSLTCYTKEDVAVDGVYMERNKEKRAVIKHKAADALGDKNYELFDILNSAQKTKKIKNNAYTGGASLLHLPYATHTHHYTFTSVTSMMTGCGNTISERFIGGNRLYYDLQSIIDEMHLIVNNMDVGAWDRLAKQGVYKPTAKDVLNIIRFSANLYFDLPSKVIKRYLKSMSDLELMAIAYTGDYFQFDKYNPTISSNFLVEAITKIQGTKDDYDLDYLNSQDTTEMTHLHKIFANELSGVKLGYEKHKGTDLGGSLTLTLRHFRKVINDFGVVLKPLSNTKFLYVNTQRVKEALRRVVPLSDTDSVTPIAQYWVNRTMYIVSREMYEAFSKGERGPETASLYSTVQAESSPVTSLFSMLTSYQTKHQLRIFGSNMNVTRDKWDTLEMKPEFLFDVFAPLPISKHYAKSTSLKECFVYEDKMKEIEVSGVGLIANNASKRTLDKQKEILGYIQDAAQKKTVAYEDVLETIYEYEQSTIKIANGKVVKENGKEVDITELLSLVRVNDKEDYVSHLSSVFFARMLYEPFSKKYGAGGLTGASYGYTIPLTMFKKVDIINWLKTLDTSTAKQLEDIIFKQGKKASVKRIFIPREAFELHGIPKELLPVVDIAKLTQQAFKPVHTASLLLGVAVDEITALPLSTSHGIHVPDEYLKTAKLEKIE